MGGGISKIVRVVAGIGTLGLSEAAYFQPKMQYKAQRLAAEAQQRAMLEARRIASEKKPMEETATLGFQTGEGGGDLSSLGLLVEADKTKRKSTWLGTPTGGTGRGTGLGFGSV